MKKRNSLFALFAIIGIIGFVMTGCSSTEKAPPPTVTPSVKTSAELSPSSQPKASDSASKNSPVITSLSPQASPSVGVTANPNVSAAKDFSAVGADLLKSDGFGALKVSMAENDLVKLLGQPDSKTAYELWGADGLEHSDWAYSKLGLKINMTRQPKSTDSAVNSLTATSPCSLTTKRSIKIGTPKAQVLSAYADSIDPAANKNTDTRIVLGTIYGGIIIDIENGTVKNIFIGASAE